MAILAAGRKIAPLTALLGNLVALVAGLLVMLVLGEVALRVVDLGHPYYSAPELYQPSADPRVLFEPRPSFDGFSEGRRSRRTVAACASASCRWRSRPAPAASSSSATR